MVTYDKFAAVYDAIGHDRFSVRMAHYTLELLRRAGVKPIDGLDLCCGTGSAIDLLCDHGLVMSGLDGSPAMLKEARRKLAGRKVKLYSQKLPRFNIRSRSGDGPGGSQGYDLITCFFDSLNYLNSDRELRNACRSVYQHLKPGGWFVFDLNTEYMLKNEDNYEQPHVGVKDDLAWIFRTKPSPTGSGSETILTFFIKQGRQWKRYDEIHKERAFSNAVVRKILRDVGFQIKGFYRCLTFERPSATTKRIAIAACRPR